MFLPYGQPPLCKGRCRAIARRRGCYQCDATSRLVTIPQSRRRSQARSPFAAKQQSSNASRLLLSPKGAGASSLCTREPYIVRLRAGDGKLSIIDTFSAVLAKFSLISSQIFPAMRTSVKKEMGYEAGTGNAGACDKKRFMQISHKHHREPGDQQYISELSCLLWLHVDFPKIIPSYRTSFYSPQLLTPCAGSAGCRPAWGWSRTAARPPGRCGRPGPPRRIRRPAI